MWPSTSIIFILISSAAAIWPAPQSFSSGSSVLWIAPDVHVTYNGANVGLDSFLENLSYLQTEQVLLSQSSYAAGTETGFSSQAIVKQGIARAKQTLFSQNIVPWKLVPRGGLSSFEPTLYSRKTYIKSLTITQTKADNSSTFKPLAGQVDESYEILIGTDGTASITAVSSVGILHALNSFTQLFYQHSSGGIYTKLAPVTIKDAPKFQHRGLNMDVARNWYAVEDILRTIDALSWNKFNILHIHMTDSQSWPMEVPTLPELAQKGAYYTGLTYSPSDIKKIQTYAIQRGIEVVIEFDMPGHTTSIGLAYPELITAFDAKPWDYYCAEPPYEVNKNAYLLDDTVGSNETAILQPLIQKLVDYNHAQLRAAGLTPVVWEEMLLDWNLTLGSDVVVQTWQSDAAVSAVTAKGHKVLAGNYNLWYLDCGKGQWLNFGANSFKNFYPFNDYCSPVKNWRLVYSYDPLAGVPQDQVSLVLGGEVHIWSEQTDPVNLDDMVWPRASAAGEILWSGRQDANGQNRSQLDAAPRLAEMRERMVVGGIKCGPVQMVFCTQNNSTESNLHLCTPQSQCATSGLSDSFLIKPLLLILLDTIVTTMIETILDKFENVSLKTAGLSLIGLFAVVIAVKWVNTELKIRALGGHTRKAKTWLPWDLDLIVRAIHGTLHHQNLQVWNRWFSTPQGMSYTCEAKPGGRRLVFTADPENIKAILAAQFASYGKGEPFHRDWKDFLGDSIFATDGDKWHASRQLIRPQFVKDRVSDLDVFEEHVQILLKVMGKAGQTWDGKQGKPFDISDLLFRYTLDASTHFLLGHSVGSLELAEQDFAEAFNEVQRVQNIIARAGPFNWFVPRKAFFRNINVIDEFINQFIDRTLRLSPEELATKSKSDEGYTFLHALAGFTRDRTVLRDQLIAVLLAGRDTTASTMSWTFYELARYPEVVKKLRHEIIEHVGLERAPTYHDLKNMKYLQNVMNETLRLYPAVPFNVRLALKDTTLPRGGGPDGLSPMGILKDTPIGYSTLIMQRRPDLTPDPDTFRPERWESWQPKPWHYIPFNGGPRICIGQQFALTEMGYTIVRILQKYERIENYMTEVDGGNPCLKAEIVLQPGQGVHIALLPGEKST
ncbi:putative cytochrome 52A4 [Tricladium varicosporioides]|nr:putative cytochrome 52A4 [Hymenoscyphus varicosporioides]